VTDVPIAAHFVNKPDPQTRHRYEAAFRQLDELGARHPDGRLSHTSWIVGTELHVLDVWESQAKLDAFFRGTLGQVIDESGMALANPPEIGDVVQILLSP
jgi:hypothetical protein